MPTKKPSIHAVVDQSVADLYKRAARAQNRSVSSLVSELLSEVAPMIETLTETLELAHGLPKETLLKIASDMSEGEEFFKQRRAEVDAHISDALRRAKQATGTM